MFVCGMGCSFGGWGVCIRDGVLVNGMECYFPGWGVSVWDGVLKTGLSVSIRFGALINRIEC